MVSKSSLLCKPDPVPLDQASQTKHPMQHSFLIKGLLMAADACRSFASIALKEGEDTVTVSREALELLQLKDRAMDSIKEGITIADCSLPDMPLIYANQGFVQITGCPVAEVLGKNCRFLQVGQCSLLAIGALL